jgi:hypothetical protein
VRGSAGPIKGEVEVSACRPREELAGDLGGAVAPEKKGEEGEEGADAQARVIRQREKEPALRGGDGLGCGPRGEEEGKGCWASGGPCGREERGPGEERKKGES